MRAIKVHTFQKEKYTLVFGAFILGFTLLAGRLCYLMIFRSEELSKKALNIEQRERTIKAARGKIYDRNGIVLADNQAVCSVSVIYYQIKEPQKVIKLLSQKLALSEEEVKKKVEKVSSREKIKSNVPKSVADEIREAGLDGVKVDEDYKRYYPFGTLASKVLGFAGADNQGILGIESRYDDVLKGTDGKILTLTDYQGIEIENAAETRVEPVNGNDLYLSADYNVQCYVQQAAEKVLKVKKAKRVSVILMNPQNGEILAEASYPNYDLNNPRDLTKLHTEEELAALSDEEKVKELNSLWNNFCISSGYEPGSTFKPFTISEGLDLGVLTGDESYVCNGVLHVGDHDIHCSNRDGHGTQSLKVALENSCNVALMQIGSAIGKEQFVRYQQLFGFGQSTGIDLPGEAAGLLYSLEDMDSSTLATNAFGQNFNVTMTQLAASFCSLINGGNYYEPHVVKQIQDENGNVTENKDPVLVRHTISKETSDIIKDYMLGVVEEGTAKTAAVEGYDVGGKTGTAEKLPRGNGKYLVSFIGYAPQENPQVMVYVVIDEPNVDNQANSKLATTMASQIMTEIFPYLGVEKSADAKAADAKSSDSSASSDSSGDTPDDMATESGDGE